MSLRAYRTFQALVLAVLGLFLLFKAIDGQLLLYINQRLVALVLLAGLVLAGLAQVVLRERPASGDDQPLDKASAGRAGLTLWLMALPVLAGLLLPEHPSEASLLARRGISTIAGLSAHPASSAQRALEIPSTQRSVLDWIRISNENALNPGELADVVGFVVHDARLEQGQLLIGRFGITCCVADSVAVGMLAAWPDAAALPDNQWVRVRGPIELVEREGRSQPMIAAQQVELIPEPAQPYLYP